MVATSSITSTDAQPGARRRATKRGPRRRASAASPVCGGPGRRSRRPTHRGREPPGDGAGQQLGGIEAPRRRRSRLVGAQVTTVGTAASSRSTARRPSATGQPRHHRPHVAVLDPGHQLAGDALVGEGRPPGVDARPAAGPATVRCSVAGAARAQRARRGAPQPGHTQREQGTEHAGDRTTGVRRSLPSVGSSNLAARTDAM